MRVGPKTNLLNAFRGERTNYLHLAGEAIDNSFDANASKISITITDDEVTLDDDGDGITSDRIGSVFSLGDHGRMASTKLGRYGVGIKMQAINAGNTMHVISKSADGRIIASVDWQRVHKSGEWEIDDPIREPIAVGDQTGTIIVIGKLRHPPKFKMEAMRFDIAKRFHPAIMSGKKIVVNGYEIEALPEPQLTNVVERHLEFDHGKRAFLRAGILAQPSKLNKVHVAYEHRVIMPESILGCDGYSGITKIFARVQLGGIWRLAKFKDDLSDDSEREDLADAVADAIRPILEKVNSASMEAKLSNLMDLLNDGIRPELSGARRPKSVNPGNSKPSQRKSRGGIVDVDKSTPDGPAKAKRTPRDKLLITFDGIADEDGIGAVQSVGKSYRVNLSKDDPLIARLIEHRDDEIAVDCLRAIAFSIFEEGRQAKSPDMFEVAFGRRISKHLSVQDVTMADAVA